MIGIAGTETCSGQDEDQAGEPCAHGISECTGAPEGQASRRAGACYTDTVTWRNVAGMEVAPVSWLRFWQ